MKKQSLSLIEGNMELINQMQVCVFVCIRVCVRVCVKCTYVCVLVLCLLMNQGCE